MKNYYLSRFISMVFILFIWLVFTIAGIFQKDFFIIISGLIVTSIAFYGTISSFKEWRNYNE